MLVVISAKLVLILRSPAPDGLAKVSLRVLTTDHEANLTGGIGGNGREGVFGHGKDLLAILSKLGDQVEMKPLVFACKKVVSRHFSQC